ncbi:Cationic amino acid transporter 1 [Colletotrichum orbiculare MAFF 240422]|uniref:Cationic amino acid transporter 1 n=1 Tax=Colletotrichum orbiculare (strain 104-T / ATCC 96160 / CBS 514.97 / LARS 414 / MAFF 240422) TaxID=1213857 RepID=A0A484FTR1_COLOR|nr:Cationic amino acid transporter 1 [Colletotrichum orbiculare MAFF 240422]
MYPLPSAFIQWTTKFVDPAAGFALGWCYWFNYWIAVANELQGIVTVLSFWNTSVPKAAWLSIFWVVIALINIGAVTVFAEVEVVMAAIKFGWIFVVIVASIVISAGGAPNHEAIGFRYWNEAPFLNGFKGFLTVMPVCIFALSGSETTGLVAAELSNPRKAVPNAVKSIALRLAMFYLLGSSMITITVSPSDPNLFGSGAHATDASPFVVAFKNAGLEPLAHMMNVVIFLSVLSSGSINAYAGSRTLVGLAEINMAPSWMKRADKQGRPWSTLLPTLAIGGGLSYLNISNTGRSVNELPWRTKTWPWAAYWGLAWCIILTIVQFYLAVWPFQSETSVKYFFSTYVSVPIGIIIFIAAKTFYRGRRWVDSRNIDLDSDRRFYSEDPEEMRSARAVANFGPRVVGPKKLSRKIILDVNIPRACEKVKEPGAPISLRLQSMLLCGMARTYLRQCHYMLGDAERVQQLVRLHCTLIGGDLSSNATSPNAGKVRREQIVLSDDPGFVPSNRIPMLELDDDILFGSQFVSTPSTGRGNKSQSQMSPFPDLIDLDLNSHIVLDLSSSNCNFSPIPRQADASTFLPQTRKDVKSGLNMDQLRLANDIDDDFAGFEMNVDENGALIDDDIELPPLPRAEHLPVDPKMDEQQQNQQQGEDPIMFDGDIPIIDSDPFAPRQENGVEAMQTSEEAQSEERVAPAKKRRRVTMAFDKDTSVSIAIVKNWQTDYAEHNERLNGRKRRKVTIAEARDNAYHLVLGRGLFNVGDREGATGLGYPLGQFYAGNGLRDRVFGPPEPGSEAPETPSRRGRRRTSDEAFGEEAQERHVRPKNDDPPEQGRPSDEDYDLGHMFVDDSLEMGMEAAQAMSERMSSSMMPWNQTPSVGRGSSIGGPNPQQAGRQLSSLRGSSLPPFDQLPDLHQSDVGNFPNSQGIPSEQGEGLLDGVQDVSQNESHWSHSSRDVASTEFLQWVEGEALKTGQVREEDALENRRWVRFEDLVDPDTRGHIVAAQAFYHILALATKSAIRVEQESENMEPFGQIHIGVDVTA